MGTRWPVKYAEKNPGIVIKTPEIGHQFLPGELTLLGIEAAGIVRLEEPAGPVVGNTSVLLFLSTASSLFAAVICFIAATMPIRDSLDDFMKDMRKQGRWAAIAAALAAISVVFQTWQTALGLLGY